MFRGFRAALLISLISECVWIHPAVVAVHMLWPLVFNQNRMWPGWWSCGSSASSAHPSLSSLGSATKLDRTRLKRTIRSAERVIGAKLPPWFSVVLLQYAGQNEREVQTKGSPSLTLSINGPYVCPTAWTLISHTKTIRETHKDIQVFSISALNMQVTKYRVLKVTASH